MSVLFVNLDPKEKLDVGGKLTMLQNSFDVIHPVLLRYEGSINKVFMFDKVSGKCVCVRVCVCVCVCVRVCVCVSGIRYSYLVWGTVSHRLFKWHPQRKEKRVYKVKRINMK